ncbi:MAG: bifunctional 2-polyprenyl-6-hydroxyphenol methylase/3-demethylubiquinol 3-O-methyltransferase UbiG [Cyanobacteria bacterium J06598_1]
MQRNNLSYYDQWAPQWWQQGATVAPLNRLNPLRFQFFDRYVFEWQQLKVLDVGCGGGFTCEFLATRGAQVVGIDQSASCIESAQRHAAKMGLAIDYRQAYGEQLPFEAGTFDVVVCVDVLEHVANLDQTIAEISRVLKPQGQFCFDTINRTWQSKLVMIWLLENTLRQIPVGIHDWQQFITPAELTELLTVHGMQPSCITGFDLFGKGILAKGRSLWRYWRSGQFQVSFEPEVDRVMYIGVGTKVNSGMASEAVEV